MINLLFKSLSVIFLRRLDALGYWPDSLDARTQASSTGVIEGGDLGAASCS
jgi:hypothetical protein